MGIITNDDFINNIIENGIADKFEILSEYRGSSNNITCKCKKCEGVFETKAISLTRKKSYGCPICRGLKVVKGINDLATKRPDLVKYVVNIEDAYTHTVCSCKEILVECPICKTQKISTPNRLSRQGFGCVVCSDNTSYPNKFLHSFLKQLDLDFLEFEKSPKWVRPYHLDSYFGYKGKEYVVEMDGNLGHGFKDFKTGGVDELGKSRDRCKELKALERGVELIRIDCRKSEMNYIKNNILNSRLSEIFDLSEIDWNKCNENGSKNILYEICELYNSLPQESRSAKNISNIINMNSSNVVTYLKRGKEIGICDYSTKQAIIDGQKRTQKSLRKRCAKKVYVNGSNFSKTYDSQYECLDDMSKLFPNVSFNLNGIISACTGKVKTFRGFTFSYCE